MAVHGVFVQIGVPINSVKPFHPLKYGCKRLLYP